MSGSRKLGATWSHDLADRRTGATLGNGVASVFDFDVNSRLTHIRHAKDVNTLFEVSFGHDAAGVRTYTRDQLQTTRSELYGHDQRDRLRSFGRGTLNAGGTAITTPLNHAKMPSAQGWASLDRRGNWSDFSQTVNGATTPKRKMETVASFQSPAGQTQHSRDRPSKASGARAERVGPASAGRRLPPTSVGGAR